MNYMLKIFVLVVLMSTNCLANSAIINYTKSVHSQIARNGMVVTQESIATDVGQSILKQGGNAVDAAVAVGYALAVTLPRAGNIGGGGFMIVHLADTNQTVALDYREMAPSGASKDMFLDLIGQVDQAKTRYSHVSAGVPGTVAGLDYALQKWGSMPRTIVMAPAIKLAKSGIVVNSVLADSLAKRADRLSQNKASKKKYFKPNGEAYELGDVWRQPELARSLSLIQKHGAKAFYQGGIADLIAADMKANGGLISRQDLANYQVIERAPLVGEFYGFQVASMPPPSSGGVHLLQILNMLQSLDIKKYSAGSANYYAVMAESAKYAYADRSLYMGDPDFYDVPVNQLLSPKYIQSLVDQVIKYPARPSSEIKPGKLPGYESPETTHFSIVDRWGNAVSNTYTLNFSFGSGITVPGTGIILNNEMDDFSAKPGVANGFGLIGGEANKIEPRKRPLSSMTPTIVFKNGKPYLITGSPGGSAIISVVLQTIVNTIAFNLDLASATMVPRMHHQWLPDTLNMEPNTSPDTINLLKNMGYSVSNEKALGSTQSIIWDGIYYYGYADTRRPGAKAAGF
jgi:gamma-glutamyltranspeptidase / glutathione hydrolase